MKKLLLSICILLSISYSGYSQCSVNSTPGGWCGYGQFINSFALNGVASTGNAGCNNGGYTSFASPVRTLMLGQTYTWSATVGNWGYPLMGIGIWIDLDNDGDYSSSEMVASSNMAINHAGSISIPMTAVPGASRPMRVKSFYYSNPSPGDACATASSFYAMETEDYKVDLLTPPNCTGTGPTSVIFPTFEICPNGTATLGLANTYTNYGYNFQWQYAQASAVGPWTLIPGANQPTFSIGSMTATSYFTALITCTNVNGTVTATAGQVTMAATHVDNVPYYEDFESIHVDDELPNCSWLNPNLFDANTYTNTQTQNRSARSGTKFATFYTSYNNTTSYMYSNGINMLPGITYSASMWYKTDFYGNVNVTDLSIKLGTSQTSSGLVNIATASPATSGLYKAISGTFQVPSAGVYYVAIECTSNGNYGTDYVSWDDLAIEIPCSLNSTSVTLATTQNTVCSGETITLTATGADSYTWNTGSNNSTLNEMPNGNFIYSVVGESTLTGCADTKTVSILVYQTPQVLIFSDKAISCAGSSVHLSAYGADAYTWTPANSNNPNITVTPSLSTTYSVTGSNQYGCQMTSSQQVSVVANPTVIASSSAPDQMCIGETQTLTGTGNGVTTFQWAANTLFIQSQQAVISPQETTTYTLVGTNAFGCQGRTTFMQTVDACTGINKIASSSDMKIYPNPSSGLFTIELNSRSERTLEVSDIAGRVVFSTVTSDDKVNVNISHLANGVYYVKLHSSASSDVLKIVKQ